MIFTGQRLLRPAGAWCPAWSRRTTEKSPSLGAVEEDVRDGDVPVNHPSISSARPCLDLEAGMIAGGVVLVAPSPRPQVSLLVLGGWDRWWSGRPLALNAAPHHRQVRVLHGWTPAHTEQTNQQRHLHHQQHHLHHLSLSLPLSPSMIFFFLFRSGSLEA
uniref:Uncharacterized protein n=1 Tax=Aegilops tauschii subsp. strangulata TaxID=200361 RepID=A0A453DMF4_AEGTS